LLLACLINKWNYAQELQRRLDQTLGKPGSYLAGIDRVGNVKPMTVGARMYRVEQQLSTMDRKLDQLVHAINNLAIQQQQKVVIQQPQTSHHQTPYYPSGPLALTPVFDNFNQQYQAAHNNSNLPAGPSQPNTPISSIHLEDDV
jgi:potassium voltage-gated channel KQT-like subfamily protein 1